MAQSQRKGTPAKGGGNRIFYVILGVIALGGVLAIAYAAFGRGGEAATEPVQLDFADARALYDQATPVRMGSPDAPVKVVEFADFQCPGCAEFSLRVRPRIEPYVESGVAEIIYYDFPLGGSHVHSFLAARAARCAGEQPGTGAESEGEGEGAYWAYHDKLYQEQANWSAQRAVTDQYIEYAREIGLDAGAFERCLRSDRFADVVTANRMLGEQLGVRSTPTVLVNNQRIGGNYIQEMGDNAIEAIEAVRARDAGSEPAAAGEGAGTAGR